MNRIYTLVLFLIGTVSVFSQDTCASAIPFCNEFGSPDTVVNGGNAQIGPDYGCLQTQPNPSWSVLKIQDAGTLQLQISQVDNNGVGIDVDFICYGPFNDPLTPCQNGLLTAANTVACGYTDSAIENLTISNAQVGEYYLILITNFSGQDGALTFTQTNANNPNAGQSDCSILCTVSLDTNKSVCLNFDYTLTTTLGNSNINATYKWFKNGVEILGETNDELIINSSVLETNTYKVQIDSDICDDVAEDGIVISFVDVISNLKISDITTLENCDNDNDGFFTFDLTANESEIANTANSLDYIFTYYKDPNLTQQIGNPSNYTNTKPYNETVYVTIKHNTFIGCEATTEFEIHVFDTPIATQLDDWNFCDDDNDGFYEFDLNSLNEEIYNGQNSDKHNITFHFTQDEADNNINLLPILYTNDIAFEAEEIFIRIENNNKPTCFSTSSFNIHVIRTPESTQIDDWIVCDSEDNDGFTEFDLSTLTSDLLNGQDETQINVSFYQSQVDADYKITPLALNYTNKEAFEQEEIFVRLESAELESCYSTTSFYIQVIQNPVFDIIEDTQYICVNLLPQTVHFEIENMQEAYSFSWKDANGNELSTTTSLDAEAAGDYTITATTTDGNDCATTKTVHLLPAAPANIIDFAINEYWKEENFSIDVVVLGSGVYEYAIDNELGVYQDEPYFTNVTPGVHTIYVREKNNCGISSKTIDVFGFSPFFTPNGDGKHDIWKVQGINFKPLEKIYIFDRYGKLMTQFYPALNEGWDGNYNGIAAPDGDYWFTAEMTNYKGEPIIRKGHFSLIRTNN